MSIVIQCVDSIDDSIDKLKKQMMTLEAQMKRLNDDLEEERLSNINIIKKLKLEIKVLERRVIENDRKAYAAISMNHSKITDMQNYMFNNHL